MPRRLTRSTPSPARRSAQNGCPVRVSSSGPSRSVSSSSRAASMKAFSIRLVVVSTCSPKVRSTTAVAAGEPIGYASVLVVPPPGRTRRAPITGCRLSTAA